MTSSRYARWAAAILILATIFRLWYSVHLELVGDDILAAGVAVMARPPGKRNSTIHLLSGGEKALTAVALVFLPCG